MKQTFTILSLCLSLCACGEGQIFESPDLTDSSLALERQSLADMIAHPVDPEVPVENPDFPQPGVDPTMDPPDFEPDPVPDSPFPLDPGVDPTMDPVEPEPAPEPTPDFGPDNDGVTDPVDPEPQPEVEPEPDLGENPYAEKTCRTEQRCHTVASGTECTEMPQKCDQFNDNCTTEVKKCRTIYAEVCSPVEVCEGR